MKSLFKLGDFILHCGQKSDWIIDCNALTDDDWEALALIGSRLVPPFSQVVGIPRGGLSFANSMAHYRKTRGGLLIVDDVYTTGTSLEVCRADYAGRFSDIIGLVAFARAPITQPWIKAIWTDNSRGG